MSRLAAPRSEPEASGVWTTYLWAALAGLIVPVLILLVGLIATLLNLSGLDETRVRLGSHLTLLLPERFVAQRPLLQLTELVAVTFLIATLFSLAIWMLRRNADSRARNIVKALHRKVLRQSLKRAEIEGAAAQYVRAEQLLGSHLPSIQKGLSMWYRAIPRSVLMLISSVVLALLVNVWLALLAVISGVLLWWLYHWLRHAEGKEVSDWEVPRSRRRMAEIVGQAPLLARLQTQGLADRAFETELDSLYRRLGVEEARRGRLWPLLFLATSVAIAVLVLGLGGNLLVGDTGLSVPSALVLGLSLVAAVTSADRLAKLSTQLRLSGDSSDAIYMYLRRNDDAPPSEQRVGLAGLRDSVSIDDVTLKDSTGKPILQNLSLKLHPKSFVAMLGTESVSTRALTELIMGFGRPTNGQVSIDGIPLVDVHPQALARHVMWVEPSGPLWDGTIEENIRGGDASINNSDLVNVLERLDVYDRLQRLPEGLNTYMTIGDTQLPAETTYAIGIARAMLHRPSVLIAMEPAPPAEHLPEDPCLACLKKLSENGTLVVMLPKRLQTLRMADRVVLLNGSRIAGEGKHAELLNSSDLYRHMNYLLFNPYRHSRA
ncbi:ATP-binding cassette domain-containing protein [Novipirellula artificiosorum]|uniref:Multidrug resistance ABC transporter ATP-binding and permease protein n=1 Tax=Novipirellula artificiosorum TaxID=2528016 RepID=A0A5C6D975_9BACT|nr:ABC transporter ATP-binding protein [Novipirellula artificiosorum]TWU33703.1 Multidrug resistance ABC transporter ATP-binding and permease protein [Novipirellula artificiosorum]